MPVSSLYRSSDRIKFNITYVSIKTYLFLKFFHITSVNILNNPILIKINPAQKKKAQRIALTVLRKLTITNDQLFRS